MKGSFCRLFGTRWNQFGPKGPKHLFLNSPCRTSFGRGTNHRAVRSPAPSHGRAFDEVPALETLRGLGQPTPSRGRQRFPDAAASVPRGTAVVGANHRGRLSGAFAKAVKERCKHAVMGVRLFGVGNEKRR